MRLAFRTLIGGVITGGRLVMKLGPNTRRLGPGQGILLFDSAGCRPHCLVSRGSLGFVFAAACSKRVFQRIERNRERGRVRVFRRRPGASVTRLRFCISEQIFPKLPESSFGRESVRELIAFIAANSPTAAA